ncbi:DNA cytosine methyltransferase [Coleofasciculus sp. FACHB-64]|uniref:DNA cytosine methyltransferase n=1 Tax=Cyanophyceae TaxID=3028117 RepID=UPI00168398A7|nr:MULTISPECIES: DNA cytosine methyltransferase [unclassified Coleofasciculus]MBD1903459.1 DNA cytosine methyltransferase [Coleofasciculus sp. FACHB-125]MBD1942548.1 DNA cytosine methyltransferase [Coleofasciculus sp. FACHB-712]MBD2044100.1 DNA cytosine methyltransferase [Coleofasciculus sp. FACHB-64]
MDRANTVERTQQFTQLDFCSGVGAGFALAGLQLGFDLVGLCENNLYCRDILSKRYPRRTILGDIKHLDWTNIKYSCITDADIITASPPCQPFSVQGKRKGADDERDCFPAVIRAIAAVQPRFFCIENVPGLLSCPFKPGWASGSYFEILAGAIEQIGYRWEKLLISSGHFGSPFLRERVLLVGISRGLKFDWGRATTWTDQVREFFERERASQQGRGIRPGYPKRLVQHPEELARPLGVPSGSGTIRSQRAAAGNLLDPRVAAVALRRVLYLSSLC